jgi:hypothetical protein
VKHSEHWTATLSVKHSELSTEGPDELSRDLLALARKLCGLVTNVLTAHHIRMLSKLSLGQAQNVDLQYCMVRVDTY